MCLYEFYCSVASTWKNLSEFLKVFTWLTLLVTDLVLYLFFLVLSTLMWIFVVFSTFGITWDCGSDVSDIFQFSF